MAAIPYANAEAVVYTSDWTPTASPVGAGGQAYQRTDAILCTSAGTLVCDLFGGLGIAGKPGNTSVSIPMAVNQLIELAVVKVHMAGTSGTWIALYN